jgi:Ser/Thr protein kinase RdoA (MazF antagonist)
MDHCRYHRRMVEILSGGMNQVVRDGDRVRRPTGFWSPRVHDLLRHLAAVGFTGAPRLHSAGDGVEELSFLPGVVSNYPPLPEARTTAALESAAALLREYHDAVAVHAARAPRDGWLLPALDPVEVICHSDYAPHNCVINDGRVTGVIDFDYARPGPRLWDVAFAAYRWVPLSAPGNADGFGTVETQAVRLRLFTDAYGLTAPDREALVPTTVARVRWLVDHMYAEAEAGNEAFAGHLAAGHHRLYLGDAAYIESQQAIFEEALR